MLDSDFWRDLATKFRALPDPEGLISAHWTSERRRPFEWSVQSTKVVWGGISARAQFEALAARGGAMVENPTGRDLLSAWFDAMNNVLPGDYFGSGGEVVDGKPSLMWGTIHRICEVSATFCNMLESRALEAERMATVEQERKDNPKNWPLIVQQWEAHKSVKEALAMPREKIPEHVLRHLLSLQHSVGPEEITSNQIRIAFEDLARYYPAIEIVPSITATDHSADATNPTSEVHLASKERTPQNRAGRRFAVALSFPGEARERVSTIALQLAKQLGRDRILYDQFHESEFARPKAVDHQPERFDLRGSPLVAEDYRDFLDSELARGLQPEVAIHHFTVAASEHWDLEAKLADTAAHAIHGSIVLAWISRVFYQPFDRPSLNALRLVLRNHASPSKTEMCEGSFVGCALRWPVELSLWDHHNRLTRVGLDFSDLAGSR